jgi:SAM-dependent methyltransferase
VNYSGLNYNGLIFAQLESAPHLGGNIRGGDAFTWCPRVWDYVIDRFGVASVIDYGSGSGNAALYFHRRGLKVCAVDGLDENIENAVYPTIKHDLTTGPFIGKFDLIHCQEVVEHIDEVHLPNLLMMFACAKFVLMTHAVPDQPGFHHVNCQPAEYWIKHMEGISFVLLEEDSNRLRNLAKSDGAKYMGDTGLMFGNTKRM